MKINFEEVKKLWKFFVLFFLIFLIFINWDKIFLFFNYKVISHNVSLFFERQEQAAEKTIEENAEKKFILEISKAGILAPIVFSKEGENDPQKLLQKGVFFYPNSVLPGEKGIIIILGHSAPAGWPDINYDNVFNNLDKLKSGDTISLIFGSKKYAYQVYNSQIFFPKDEDKYLPKDNKKESILVLLTCWPPGKDYQRLAVFAKLSK